MIKKQLKIIKKQEKVRKMVAKRAHEVLKLELRAIKLRTFVAHHQKLAKLRVKEERRLRAREEKKEKRLVKHQKALLRAAIRRAMLPDPTDRVWTREEKKAQPKEYKAFKTEQRISANKRVAAVKAKLKA